MGTGGGAYDPVASFVYDGGGNRIQQIDHTGSQPITTTYTNDNIGLSQVLMADDGTTQTANLYGLDLISQDDGTGMRNLLTDGLGSVRQEMVGSAVATTTTYAPYGTILAQTGTSGSVYGYTGEQEDSATGLVYLRARYYNPALQVFMGRDAYPGQMKRPSSLNGHNYVYSDPINYTDPSGLCAEVGDEACWSYLESQFCSGGLCAPGNWQRWIIADGQSVWKIAELQIVREMLTTTKTALELQRFNWTEVIGENWRFERFNMARLPRGFDRSNSIYHCTDHFKRGGYPPPGLVGLQLAFLSSPHGGRLGLSDQAFERADLQFSLLHEAGHAVNFTHQGQPVSTFASLPNSDSLYFSTYGRDGAVGERWAEAFAAYIRNTFVSTGDSLVIPDPGITNVNWDNIHIAVHTVLTAIAG